MVKQLCTSTTICHESAWVTRLVGSGWQWLAGLSAKGGVILGQAMSGPLRHLVHTAALSQTCQKPHRFAQPWAASSFSAPSTRRNAAPLHRTLIYDD